MTSQTDLIRQALSELPEYLNLVYTKHAINASLQNDRQVSDQLPKYVKLDQVYLNKVWYVNNNTTLEKIRFQVDIGLKNLALELVVLPSCRHVKTVYKTKKCF